MIGYLSLEQRIGARSDVFQMAKLLGNADYLHDATEGAGSCPMNFRR